MHKAASFAPTVLNVALGTALLLSGCATPNSPPARTPDATRTATIQRTAHGVPHISAPDFETLAYGIAYAHAQDNVCQTAQQLVSVRGERSRYFGAAGSALLGFRDLPNAVIDPFIDFHMDDVQLAGAYAKTSPDAQALARGYVAGYNRFLADNANNLPAECKGQPWVLPMTAAQFRRLTEVALVQAGVGGMADGVVGASPPTSDTSAIHAPVAMADAVQALREMGLLDSGLGSNAWAFGKDSTGTGRGVLLGNPHFPWVGVNRFWMMHLTVPGQLDVMGASTGHTPVVNIGFNHDVAWTHTVSTGKRFTLHELELVPGDPTSYRVDGQPQKMTSRHLSTPSKAADGSLSTKTRTLWSSRWGPVVVLPRAGLHWTTTRAYAVQDANSGNARALDAWLDMNRAKNVQGVLAAMHNLGMPWVNTLAVDRLGQALYADISVVPDVDQALLTRCAPSAAAAALRGPAGLVVLDGSQSRCNWRLDPASAVPGLTPASRMPVALRSDWVHNSNDSFFYTHPQQRFDGIGPLVGDDVMRRPRTRSGLIEVPELLARGPVTPQAALEQLFNNRNLMARVVLPDLLAACVEGAPTPEAQSGCSALRGWDRSNNVDARGAHVFREFWRTANHIAGVYRTPFDKAQPTTTPSGLKMGDAAVAAKVWDALSQAVSKVRAAGFALDAALGSVQRPGITEQAIAVHGGEDFEGVLNNVGNPQPGISNQGLRITAGLSYLQAVTFDERGPVALGLLSYGQSTNPASAFAYDQLPLLSRKEVPMLPFHAEDVTRASVGDVLRLTRP